MQSISGRPAIARVRGAELIKRLSLVAFLLLTGCRKQTAFYYLSDLSEEKRLELQKYGEEYFLPPRDSRRVARSVQYLLDTISPIDRYKSLHLAARSCSWLAEYGPKRDREDWAEKGIELGKESISMLNDSAEAHYYYLLNLGFYARHHRIGALKRIGLMEELGLKVVELDHALDFAGGHRFLGNLYANAPTFPSSIGDLEEAIYHLEEAVRLFPDYAENRLHLGRVYLQARQYEKAKKEFEACLALEWHEPEITIWHEEAKYLRKKARKKLKALGGNGHQEKRATHASP